MSGADWPSARAVAYAAGRELGSRLSAAHEVPLAEAAGRVLAAPLFALHPLPHYASSAMDGWAVSGPGPWRLPAFAAIPTGAVPGVENTLLPGQASPIVTGGSIPQGATAVLRREHGAEEAGVLRSDHEPPENKDIRPAATEATTGTELLPSGTRLTPAGVAVAALSGHDRVLVAPRIPVRLVFTGGEVTEAGVPGKGFVRDAFGPVLPACVSGLGGSVASAARIGDDFDATVDAVDGPLAREAAIVVTTGGTGGSPLDHLRPAARHLGAEPLVDGVAVRPGHPALLARMPDGRLLLSLPGNPLAALVAVATLLEPLLRGAAGRPASAPREALSATSHAPLPGRHRVVPARWAEGSQRGALMPAAHTGSAMMRGLATADVLLVVPPEGLAAGGPATYLPLPW